MEDECTRRVLAASVAESEAMELDKNGDVQSAIRKYELCDKELAAAIAAALPAHAADQPKLVQHRSEVLDRMQHLRSLRPGQAATIPLEQQIRAVQLGIQATSTANAAVSSAGGVKTLAACAALGAAGGLIVLGSTVGLGVAAVGGAAGAAYLATRSDKVGEAARTAGGLAVQGAEKAQELNKEHKITDKLAEAGSKAVAMAKDMNERYGIADKVSQGVSTAVTKAKEIEEKHHVTTKIAAGLSAGLSKLSSALDKPSSSK